MELKIMVLNILEFVPKRRCPQLWPAILVHEPMIADALSLNRGYCFRGRWAPAELGKVFPCWGKQTRLSLRISSYNPLLCVVSEEGDFIRRKMIWRQFDVVSSCRFGVNDGEAVGIAWLSPNIEGEGNLFQPPHLPNHLGKKLTFLFAEHIRSRRRSISQPPDNRAVGRWSCLPRFHKTQD